MAETMHLVGEGSYPTIPTITFPIGEAAKAFRYMAASKHVGKIVLTMDDAKPTLVELKPIRALTEDEDVEGGIFVVTGGLGGLGRELLRWLAQRGAKKLGVIDVISEEQLDE